MLVISHAQCTFRYGIICRTVRGVYPAGHTTQAPPQCRPQQCPPMSNLVEVLMRTSSLMLTALAKKTS